MKRILLLTCVCLMASTSSFAQIIQSVSRTTTINVRESAVYYQGELNLSYVTPFAFLVETIHGVRVNKYLFAGAGIGIQYIENMNLKGTISENITGKMRVPLFVNVKGYYPVREEIAPYLNLSIGCGFSSFEEDAGFYCDFGAGIKLNKFTIGLGWEHDKFNTVYCLNYGKFLNFSHNSFYIKLGFCW